MRFRLVAVTVVLLAGVVLAAAPASSETSRMEVYGHAFCTPNTHREVIHWHVINRTTETETLTRQKVTWGTIGRISPNPLRVDVHSTGESFFPGTTVHAVQLIIKARSTSGLTTKWVSPVVSLTGRC